MKLKDGFITHEADGEQIMVDVIPKRFSGLIRSNQTAAYIINCLKDETTPEQIVELMMAKYDAPRDILKRDVQTIITKLRGIDAVDE